jgi:hypothetical protein
LAAPGTDDGVACVPGAAGTDDCVAGVDDPGVDDAGAVVAGSLDACAAER